MATILRANGELTPNIPGPTAIVGDVPLGDNSDDTYIDCANGVVATCIALPTLPTVPAFDTLTLHIRIHVEADAEFEGTGEFFIATDPGQSNEEIAGFSDGSTSGFAFRIGSEALDGIHEYEVPINLSPWSITLAEVRTALEAGAFLDINAFGWEGGDTPPTFRIYEAWIVVGSDVAIPPRRGWGRPKARGFGADNTIQGGLRGWGGIL